MVPVRVTLSANAGLALEIGGVRLWIDALHDRRTKDFSPVSPALWARMKTHGAFARPDYIIYTHCHPDHYSRALTEEARTLWPDARLLLPEPEFEDQYTVAGAQLQFSADGLTFEFLKLPHEGAEYAGVPHYGLLLSHRGKTVLLTGDCAIASPVLEKRLAGRPVDLLVLDFPWTTLARGREWLREHLRPAHLLIDHLPLPEDDPAGLYRKAAEAAAEKLDFIPDVRLLFRALQTETILL